MFVLHSDARAIAGCVLSMNRVAPYQVLFLCTGNSARSILAEALLTKWGGGKFIAHSAGSHPRGAVHPLALDLLRTSGFRTDQLRSKSWSEFATAHSPRLDCELTVCDNAAGEVGPIWPGQPVSAHWGIEDPAAATGSEQMQRRAFWDAFLILEARIKLFVSLPFHALDRIRLKAQLDDIGRAAHGGSSQIMNR